MSKSKESPMPRQQNEDMKMEKEQSLNFEINYECMEEEGERVKEYGSKMESSKMEISKKERSQKEESKSISFSGSSSVSDVTIIGLQKSNGTWQLDDLVSVLKCDQNLVESRNPSSDITLWVTSIMLNYLEKNFSNTKDLWAMVAKKAIVFIKKTCKSVGIEYENLTQQAIQFIDDI